MTPGRVERRHPLVWLNLTGIEKYRELLGPMHWDPAPLLVDLVRSRRSIADWEDGRET
jgi:hypothetical protein